MIQALKDLYNKLEAGDKTPVTSAAIHENISEKWLKEGRIQKAIEHLNKACDDYQKVDPHHPKICERLNELGKLYTELGNIRESLAAYKRALDTQLDINPTSVESSLAHYRLASMFESIWRLDPALHHYKEAVKIAVESLGETDANTIHLKSLLKKAEEKWAKNPKNQIKA